MIRIREIGDIAVVSFKEKIAFKSFANLSGNSIRKAVFQKTDKTKLILNMNKVEILNSELVGAIVSFYKGIKGKKGIFALANLNEETSKCFNRLGLDKVFQIFDSEEEAVKKLSS